MGNWYTNICVNGAGQAELIAVLDELGRRAYVTPEVDGWTLLYDQECDKFDLDVLESLAMTISTRLSCTALASFNADDDILWLGVYENGKLATRYSSDRRQFEDASDFPPVKETAGVLSRVFAHPEKSVQVRKILRKPHGVLGLLYFFFRIRFAYLFEVHRHGDLAKTLRLPPGSVGLGYKYVNRGETPPNIKRESIRRTWSG
jgi:hypothetical protein